MRRASKREKMAVLAVFILMVIVTVGTTIAMLRQSTAAVQNEFAGAAVNIGVIENGKETPLEADNNTNAYDKIVKGVPVTKEVSIKNIDSKDYPTADTYVRVRLVPIFRDGSGATVPVDTANVVYTYEDTQNWKKQTVNGETYYYYTKALSPGDVSGKLMKAVTYTGEVPEGTTFELQVLTEGVSADRPDALNAWGMSNFGGLTSLI